MTRAEAKEIIGAMSWEIYTQEVSDEKKLEALNMAIEALEKEPSEDCIDRYSALAEVDPSSYDYKAIKELPSVVPKGSDEE